MRGHQPLIERRLSGWRPQSVYVSDVGTGGDVAAATWPEWATLPHVALQAGDNVRRIDLRFAWGLTVFLCAASVERMEAIASAFLAAGAERVFGATYREQGEELRCDVMRVFEANVEVSR